MGTRGFASGGKVKFVLPEARSIFIIRHIIFFILFTKPLSRKHRFDHP